MTERPLPVGWRAYVTALPNEPLPAEVFAELSALGVLGERARLEELESLPERWFSLLWVGSNWEGGLSWLRRIRAPRARGSTVLLGADPVPATIGDRVRRAGGLTWARRPLAEWLLPPILSAIHRLLEEETPRDPLGALGGGHDRPPEAILRLLARIARECLGCHRSLAGVQQENGEFQALQVLPDGVQPRPTRGADPPLESLPGLCARAIALREIVIVPDALHARTVRPAPGSGPPAHRAAAALPVLAPGAPPAVLLLYWQQPWLPTAPEFKLLRLLSAVAEATWARRAERQRLDQAHHASLAALSALPWAELPAAAPDAESLLRRLLSAHLRSPELIEIWASAAGISRQAGESWIGLSPEGDAALPLAERQVAAAASDGAPQPVADGRWVVSCPIGAASPPLGRDRGMGSVVAVFRTRSGAIEGRQALGRLGADLALGLRLLRRATDNGALIELSRALADATDPHLALDRMADVIRRQMAADGVKVFTVLSAGRDSIIEQLHQTGHAGPAPRRCVLSTSRGLADWVITHDDWLLLPRARGGGGSRPPPELIRTGHHGERAIFARPLSDYWDEEPHASEERTQLLVPLHRQGQVAGVLGVWRATDEPFDAELDVESMQHFAPHVTSACVRIKGMQRLQIELAGISRLAESLSPERKPAEANRNLLAEVGNLTGAPRALLFLHDRSRRGHLFFAESWARSRKHRLEVAGIQDIHVAAGEDPAQWDAALQAALRRHLSAETPIQTEILPGASERSPRGAVALVGVPGGESDVVGEAVDQQALASFLRYAGVLIDNHVQAYAHATVDRLQRVSTPVRTLHDVIDRTARLVRSATDADLVLVYERRLRDHQLHAVIPDVISASAAARELGSGRGTLTWRSIDEQRIIRVPDVADASDPERDRMDLARLDQLRQQLGWAQARSWICAPILYEGRCLGLIKAVTSSGGPFLLPDHEEVIAAVSEWAAVEAHKAIRRQMLEELNDITHHLAGPSGEELGRQMVSALEGWFERFMGRSCQLMIVAWTAPDHLLLSATQRASPAVADTLLRLSRAWGIEGRIWQVGDALDLPGGERYEPERAGVAVPLRLPGQPALWGHLFALHRRAFSPSDAAMVQEVAREVATVLNGEFVQQEWKFQAGLFRHALLGPVQGLASAAQRLGMLAREAGGPGEEIERLNSRILEEAEVIRLWRDTQRAFAMIREGSPIDIRPRPQALRPLLERCLDRYRPSFAARNIEVHFDWQAQGGLQFPFDKVALDLAVSNLLDNARKYAFYNREVRLGAAARRSVIAVWVEDIGTAIPAELAQEIYDLRTRTDRRDPLRAIHGEGLGLFIAQAVASAHGGSLYHTSIPEGASEGATTPYRVRFTLEIPHHWPRRS